MMAVQVASSQSMKYRFSVAQFEQMIKEGIFGEEEHVELIDSEVVVMTPFNHPYAVAVSNLEFIFREMLDRKAYVWAQQPVVLDDNSRPQPDVALLKWRDDRYIPHAPLSQDVLLLIEVADTSLREDRKQKHSLYARAGIAEYWIVNLRDGVIEVYSKPVGSEYKDERKAKRGDVVELPVWLEGSISVDEVFGW